MYIGLSNKIFHDNNKVSKNKLYFKSKYIKQILSQILISKLFENMEHF